MEDQERINTVSNEDYTTVQPNAETDRDKALEMAYAGKISEENAARMGRLAQATEKGDIAALSEADVKVGKFHLQDAKRDGKVAFESLAAGSSTGKSEDELAAKGFREQQSRDRQRATVQSDAAGADYSRQKAEYARNLATLKADPGAVKSMEQTYGIDNMKKHYPGLYDHDKVAA